MPQRSDARRRMVQAARQLIRQRGYHATAISDVLERSGAPRGSVYFHFPGGKTQLAAEAAEDHAHEQVALIDEAAERAGSARELIEIYVALARDGMVTSGYSRGCGIAPLVTEAGPEQSDEIAETARRAFSAMIDRMAFHFVNLGLDRAPARQLADAVIAGMEGALVTARALRSPAPFEAVLAVLAGHASAVTPKGAARKGS
jgi:TetR/AcrR family transcriptional regulator, lmrAB and yxaGH operons repressor